ncbi:uncharacterized protein EV154DRAFT_434512 [Mucor mucedo]|uniref:uncharacterized protein n=1 Tax=Mucor mucedo TaxID=29922 RepID=UPI00221ED0C0|nr:uncharacterized protein EV154DRAFT_434512 [Mucor mucedo]KAI7896537.1 hypothetical protein EV154DRAFT_434512 [Mucor mucedo]
MLITVVSSLFLILSAGVASGAQYFDLDPQEFSFNQSKSIFIATSIGGSSHTKWVLEIGRILANRGHNITYVTRDDQLALADAFPQIQAVSTGPPVYDNILDKVKSKNFYEIAKVVRKFLNKAYQNDMRFYEDLFTTVTPDFFICDAFNDPCIDTATKLNVPFAITCTGILHQDIPVPYINSLGTTAHATSESMTMWERFHHKYVDLIKIVYHLYPEMKELDGYRTLFDVEAVGLNRYKKWENALKLINSYFGFQPPQILSPLTHMVGPVLSAKQKELTAEEAQFLDSHKKVAYVAFGQVAVPNKREIEILASALLDQVERHQLDGVIWVGLKRHIALNDDGSSWSIKTSKRTMTFTTAMLIDYLSKHVFMPNWASQFAVLAHDATALFVSHGGAESANEATFNGVPILINPYYGDQLLVGRALTIAGVARVYDRSASTFESVKKEMDILLMDTNGQVARNVSRMMVLAKMGSKRKGYAADLVEEHMFASDKGISHHRYEVSRKISKIKSTNIDLHFTVFSFAVLSGVTFYFMIYFFKTQIK